MPYLCPKGIDFGAKPSVPFCPPTLPPYLGVPNEHTESQGTPPRRGLPWPWQKLTTLVLIQNQTIEVRKAQRAKTKSETQDEMEDDRQRDKEKQVSPIYPWDHM